MPIILPKEPVAASAVSPRRLILYGMPKVGKTEVLRQLTGCLIVDTEEGTALKSGLKVEVHNHVEYREVITEIIKEGESRSKKGMSGKDLFPYPYVAIDTLDALEDYAEIAATIKYKNSVIGKSFKGNSVLELPNGGGYYYLRNELTDMVNAMASVTPRLIMITHIKEKYLTEKDGVDAKINDISLTGKISAIMCSRADAIGYMYRQAGSPLMVSFETHDRAVMGSRCEHLAGKRFEFDWNKIYID